MLRKSAWAALLCAVACKNGLPPPAAAVPGTCSGDSECQEHFRCDREQRRCVCTGDEACPGQFCNAFTGLCVASVGGCTSDTACGAGNYCNTALRTCKPVTAFCQACRTDGECGADSRCAAHPDFASAGNFCQPVCASPAAGGAPSCANGLACKKASTGASLCYPAAGGCGQSNACVPDSLRLCATDSQCGDAAQSCDLTLKACVARVRSCPAGDACDPQASLCVHACGSDDECVAIEHAPGYQCRANACFRRALCAADGECTSGQICQPNPDGSKSCRVGCVSANDCPLGQGCNTTDPAHPRCAAGCTQNVDCPLNTVCSSGSCASTTQSCQTQSCQDTAACGIAASCIGGCCVTAQLVILCGPSDVCGSCPQTGSCNQSCSSSCFPLSLGPCATLSECQGKNFPPDVACLGGECQVRAHLQPCNGPPDCPQKGFSCLALSKFGCGGGGNVCFPYEPAAQAACGVGHP